MQRRAERIRKTGERLIPEFESFAQYYCDPAYADTFILNKMSAAADSLPDEARRRVLILRAVQLQVAWMNAWFEFNNALEGCHVVCGKNAAVASSSLGCSV